MPPRFCYHVAQEGRRYFRQPHEHSGIVAIVLSKEEGSRVQVHQYFPLGDRGEYQNEHRIIISEASEKPAIQQE